jgi:hypothetical protein
MIGPLLRAGMSAAKRFKMKRNAKKFEKDLKKNEHVGGCWWVCTTKTNRQIQS